MMHGQVSAMPEVVSGASAQRLAEEHSLYEKRLQTLLAKRSLSEQERVEQVQLKKWKLRLKDAMERMQRQARATQV